LKPRATKARRCRTIGACFGGNEKTAGLIACPAAQVQIKTA
jgi:hypothetical protein